MTSDRYRFVCHTCDDETLGNLPDAQRRFAEHATDGCAVVLERLGTVQDGRNTDAGVVDGSTDDRTALDD